MSYTHFDLKRKLLQINNTVQTNRTDFSNLTSNQIEVLMQAIQRLEMRKPSRAELMKYLSRPF